LGGGEVAHEAFRGQPDPLSVALAAGIVNGILGVRDRREDIVFSPRAP
jgi:hypothetical protein